MIYQGEAAYAVAHNTLFEMLLCIDDICKRHQIPYQLAAGTLLGAIREGDFIKWDKDADICMLRSDFDRFMQVVEQELPPHFFLQYHKSDPYFFSLVSKLRLNGSRRIFVSNKLNPPVHEGIALDIFPFDDVQPLTLTGRLHMLVCGLIKFVFLLRILGDCKMIWENKRSFFIKLAAFICYKILTIIPKNIVQRIAIWITIFYSRRGPLPHVTCLVSMPFSCKKRLPRIRKRTDFVNTVGVRLRGHLFPAPHNYDDVLTALYGTSYMLPPQEAERMLGMQIELKK